MSLISTTKDTMLNALTITQVSAHTAFPSTTGVNEVSGGTYARVAATFAASSGGSRALSGSIGLNIPAGTTVRWLGLWNASTYLGYAPNASNPREFIVNTTTDVFSCPAHGYTNGTKVTIYGDTVPAPLTEGNVYFVVNAATDTFQIAASAGGAVIDITGIGGTGCVVSTITEEVYGGSGTHTISSWTIGLPD